ncbi:hypothetical protein ACVBEQ_27955 [Nakamurella sp. GG22]
MAVLLAGSPGRRDIPADLLNLGAQTWRDQALFEDWCHLYKLPVPSGSKSWFFRFARARDLWAIDAGYATRTPKGQPRVDHRRLIELGIPWAGALTMALADAEERADDPDAFRASCCLAPYGHQKDYYYYTG